MKWATTPLISWFSRIKQKRRKHESTNSVKIGKNSVLDLSSPIASLTREGRYYSMDEDEALWRISFADHYSGNPILSDFKAEGDASKKGECRNFSEMVSDIKKMRERRGKERAKDARETRIPKPDPDYNRKLKEIKTCHVKKAKESSRPVPVGIGKAYSPRRECKIRALEELKKARTRAKEKEKAREERVVEVNTVFDSMAVMKSSIDPQRDFKDSMVEMISEKGIGHPGDLEQLLACYLTLNCDEYHDLIISIFREVCIEMKSVSYFD